MTNESLLGYAILGLLHQQPMCGYGVRTVFATTAMGSFSDSPGSIYPALRRLETRDWVRAQARSAAGGRRRRVCTLTNKGLAAFKAWLKGPVTREDVIRGTEKLMLRFAFMDHALGARQTTRFLRDYCQAISRYLPELRQYRDVHGDEMPLSGRLALECGIKEYEARLRWARTAAAMYQGNRSRS